VDQGGGGPRLGHAVDGCLAAVGGTVVDHPEHPPGAGVRFDRHDLFDQAGERGDAGGRLAPAEDLAAVGVPGGQVGQGTAPLVLVLDPHRASQPGWQSRVAAAAGLDGGLLIRAQHEVAVAEWLAVVDSGVQVQHDGGAGGEVRCPWATQERYCHGLSASVRSQRRTVAPLMASTRPPVTASWATSAALHRDSGAPLAAGSSQTKALTWACCTGVNRGGRPQRFRSRSPSKASAANRPRHLRAVSGVTPNRRAIAALACPAAASNTTCARSRSRYGLL
jgi:hypothetical protein